MSEKLKLSRMNINDLIDVSLFNADNVKIEGFSKNIVDELSEHTSTVASKDALGHIKIGEGLDVSEDGTVSVSDEGGASSEALDEHLSDKNNPHGVTKAQVGLPNVDNVKQASKTEFDSHVKSVGNYQEEGHLKLSNATNSQSSVSDGVAATPRAVKEAYDKAVSAENKADEAFQAGNKRKKEVVDGLLSVDESLPIKESSTWNDVVKAIPQIEAGSSFLGELDHRITSSGANFVIPEECKDFDFAVIPYQRVTSHKGTQYKISGSYVKDKSEYPEGHVTVQGIDALKNISTFGMFTGSISGEDSLKIEPMIGVPVNIDGVLKVNVEFYKR